MKKQSALAVLLALLLVAGLLGGCANDLPAVYVQRVSTLTGYVSGDTTCAGVVVAQNEVTLEKDESRKVVDLKVEVGQNVSAGEVLFVYDTAQMQLNIDKAKLELEQKKNAIKDYDTQIAQLEKDKAAAPESEQLSYTVQIQSLQTDKKEEEYNITVKERELETMMAEDLSGEIKSPIDGTVQSINESGSYDQYTGETLPYMTLIQSGAYRVKGTLNELNIGQFAIGQRVLIHSRVDDSQTWAGVITEIDTAPEQNNNNDKFYYGFSDSSDMSSSSNYPFYVEPDTVDGLMLGQHIYITADNGEATQSNGIWLEESYIVAEGDSYFVWAANDDEELEKRSVKLGESDEMSGKCLVTSGLALSDRIAFPTQDLQEGAPITETEPEEESTIPPDNQGGDDFFSDEPIYEEGGMPVDDGAVYDDGIVYEEGNANDKGGDSEGYEAGGAG